MAGATYTIRVDWDNDGDFTDTYDDVTALTKASTPLVISRGRDQAREYAPPIAGSVSFALNNVDNRFSSDNTSSPIYGLVKAGRPVDVKATLSAVDYQLARAYLQTPEERPTPERAEVQITAYDGLARLVATTVDTAMYTSITTDVAVGHVLDAAGWPASARTLDTGTTTLARWWVSGISAFDALRALALTEGPGSIFYVDASGNLVFEGRRYRLVTTRCAVSQGTFSGSGSEPVFSRKFSYEPSLRGLVNKVSVPIKTFTSASSTTIWTAPTLPITLAPSESLTLEVSSSYAGFSGASISSTVSVGSLSSGPTLNRTSGGRATLTATAGASGATITALSVDAVPWTVTTQNVAHTIDTTASVAANGLRELDAAYVPEWIPTAAEGIDFANAVVGRRQNGVPSAEITVAGSDTTRLTQALTRQVSDRITVVESLRAGINDDFFIETIRHEVTGGGFHATTFGVEKTDDNVYWVLGVAGLSEVGVTTCLGY